jgi:V/A-type H+/Na+-transporting ATPase subunit E
MSSPNTTAALASSGVEALIARLREEGVQSGRAEAERIVAEAGRQAAAILREAHSKAQEVLRQAREDADRIRAAGEEALRVAMRDSILKMKGHLSTRFSEEVRRLVAADMAQEAFLARLILEVAGRARREAAMDEASELEILLPPGVVALDELRRRPEELREGSLSHFVLSVANNVLRDGVSFGTAGDLTGGIRIRLQDGEIQVDLTPERVAEVLLEHLHPRFRAILEGTVK